MMFAFKFMGEYYILWLGVCPSGPLHPALDTREEFVEILYASA